MAKVPTIGSFIDEEEKALYEAIENEDYKPPKNQLTEDRKAELKSYAKATITEERIAINIRIPKTDLMKLKAQAFKKGIPYQTHIISTLHEAV